MAPLAVRWCRNLVIQHGVAPDGGTEVERGQNVAEIKQNGSELKGNGGKDSEEEELKLFESNRDFKRDQRWLLTAAVFFFLQSLFKYPSETSLSRHSSLIVVISWLQKS